MPEAFYTWMIRCKRNKIFHWHKPIIEIKLGGADNIEKGATTLKTLSAKIDTDKMSAPAFMMVLTGIGQYAYLRSDGVCVVPIGCLKP